MRTTSQEPTATTTSIPSAEQIDLDGAVFLNDLVDSVSYDRESCDKHKIMTIDQNDLLVECFKNGADDHDSGFVVHFFSDRDADSISISQEIDSYLETRLFGAIMTSSAWKCRRVNARLAPVVTKILDIDPDQPTVVAIKHGIMVTKQTQLTSPVEPQLERWMNATENTLLLSFGEYQEQMVQNYLEDKDNAITVCTEDESDISSPVEPIESTIGGDHGYTKNCADWSSEEDSSDDSSDDDSLLDTSDDSSDEDDL